MWPLGIRTMKGLLSGSVEDTHANGPQKEGSSINAVHTAPMAGITMKERHEGFMDVPMATMDVPTATAHALTARRPPGLEPQPPQHGLPLLPPKTAGNLLRRHRLPALGRAAPLLNLSQVHAAHALPHDSPLDRLFPCLLKSMTGIIPA